MPYLATKRLFDIAASAIGLVALLPIAAAVGLLIKLSDGGPVFFAQIRIGQRGQPFRMWKFRSMIPHAEAMGAPVTTRNDPRITRLGRFLRKTKLDEWPQLWHVLTGEMSLVGPRPEVPRYVARYTPEQRRILDYQPGITDLATMLFRHEEALLGGAKDLEAFYMDYCLPKKIELNLRYADHANFWRDLWIILQTLCPYWAAVLATYALALAASFWLACALRSDFHLTGGAYRMFTHCLPCMLAPQLLLLSRGGQLRGLMSYFSTPEMLQLFAALAAAMILQWGLGYALLGVSAPGISLLLMDFILAFFVLCAVRMSLRLLREQCANPTPTPPVARRRVAIIGTGEHATNLALQFARGPNPARRVVAFFDDDPLTWNKRPHDIPVFGMPECLLNPEWVEKIDEVIVALPQADPRRLSQVTDMLKTLPLKVTLAPGLPP